VPHGFLSDSTCEPSPLSMPGLYPLDLITRMLGETKQYWSSRIYIDAVWSINMSGILRRLDSVVLNTAASVELGLQLKLFLV
jgi:hypothetical protein